MRRVVGLLIGLVVLLGPLVLPSPTTADQAPFWESPVGPMPGHPDNRVRMEAETVEIQVVERGEAVYAVVRATFDMLNRGPDVRLKVGFPSWVQDVLLSATDESPPPQSMFSPITFQEVELASFRVWTDEAEYQVVEQLIFLGEGDRYGKKWLMWEMPFPSGRPVRVNVAYEQRLDYEWEPERHYVQPMYVLRTGALWDGTIGEATITLAAPSGGAFLGGPELFSSRQDDGTVRTTPDAGTFLSADEATDATPTHLVWQLRDFEPDRDVGTTYVLASTWRALQEAEAAVAAPSPTADDYLGATRTALGVLSDWGPHGRPRTLVERYAAPVRAWAWRAVALAPERAEAWEAVGDVEFWHAMPAQKHHGELACWSSVAAEAYERASTLGSTTAAERLRQLADAREHRATLQWRSPIEPCPPPPFGDANSPT